MNLYELDHIEQQYDGKTVLCMDRLTIAPGAVLGLAGPNGSGKSTLFKLLGFIEPPTRGAIRFKDRPAGIYDAAVRSSVTLLSQDAYLLKRTVYGNVAYGLHVRKERGDYGRRVAQALEWVGLAPDLFAGRPWYALSGGEARRVALAARLVLRPEVLLLDEPTTSVDDISAARIKEAAMRAHREWNATLIIASHDMPWLRDICDDVLHLMRGKPAGTGHPTFVYGPWQARDVGRVSSPLSEQEHFLASPPPADAETAVAAIDAGRLRLLEKEAALPLEHHGIKGLLTGLTCRRAGGPVLASVAVGPLSFTVLLAGGQAGAHAFHPGQTVMVAYRPSDVVWH